MLKPLGTVHLTGCKIEKDLATHKQRSENIFVIIPPKSDGARVFFLSSESDKEMHDWMTVLRNSANLAERLPFPNPSEIISDSFGNKFSHPLKEGFVEVQGKGFKGWKQRWAVCTKNLIILYETKESAGLQHPLGIIPLHNCKVEVTSRSTRTRNAAYRTVSRKVGIESRRDWKWNLTHASRRHYIMSAADEKIMIDWIAVIAAAIGESIVAQRDEEPPPSTLLATVGPVSMSGELSLGQQGKSWERKFFIVSENILFFCRDSRTMESYKALDLENATVKEESATGQFTVTYMKNVHFLLDCRSDNLRSAWIDAINRGSDSGRKMNLAGRTRLNQKDMAGARGVIKQVDKFTEDLSKGGSEMRDSGYATTMAIGGSSDNNRLSDDYIEDEKTSHFQATEIMDILDDEPAVVLKPKKKESASAKQQPPSWGRKPSKKAIVRESKAVGGYRKPTFDTNLIRSTPSTSALGESEEENYDDDDVLGALINDPIFDMASKKSSDVCLNCGLARLEEEANFCDGCGLRFDDPSLRAPESEEDDESLDDSEKEFLAETGTSENEVQALKAELIRVSQAPGKYNARQAPLPPKLVGDRRSQVMSGTFRPMRNSSNWASEIDDDFSSVPPLPAPPSSSDEEGSEEEESEDVPLPPPRSSKKKTKMPSDVFEDDDDPLDLLDMLADLEDDPFADEKPKRKTATKTVTKAAAIGRMSRSSQIDQEIAERERKIREKREELERRKREALDRELAETAEQDRFERQVIERQVKDKSDRIARERRAREEADALDTEMRERKVVQERKFREREEKLKQMELELEEKERDAQARESAARRAKKEAQKLREQAEMIARMDEETSRKEQELQRRAEALARREREAQEEQELAEREAERVRLEIKKREREEQDRRQRQEQEEKERRRAEESERERRKMEAKLEESRRARDAAKKAKEAKERELAEADERERERAALEEQQRKERITRIEHERKNKETQLERERIEQERKDREFEELRVKMEKQKQKAQLQPPSSSTGGGKRKMTPEDLAAMENLTMFLANGFIDQKEYNVRYQQILARYSNRGVAEERKSPTPAAIAAVATPPPVIHREKKKTNAPILSSSSSVAQARPRGKTVNAPCPSCGKAKNVQKKFCPHCGSDTSHQKAVVVKATPVAKSNVAKKAPAAKKAVAKKQTQTQKLKQKQKPRKIPPGLKGDDLEACLKLRDLLDQDFIEVDEFNERVDNILRRNSIDLESVAKNMETQTADEHLDEFSQILSNETEPSVRMTTAHMDDDLLRQIGLSSSESGKKPDRTIHDEGLSELDDMLRELGEAP